MVEISVEINSSSHIGPCPIFRHPKKPSQKSGSGPCCHAQYNKSSKEVEWLGVPPNKRASLFLTLNHFFLTWPLFFDLGSLFFDLGSLFLDLDLLFLNLGMFLLTLAYFPILVWNLAPSCTFSLCVRVILECVECGGRHVECRVCIWSAECGDWWVECAWRGL